VSAVCVSLVLAAAGVAAPVDARPSASVTPCSNGLVALTFDDGPSAALTPGFLSVLQRQRVPATFFVVGEQVRANPGVARRATELGFKIGNHTFAHKKLVKLDDAAIRATLRQTRRAVSDSGARPSTLMRPPYGSIDERVRRVVADLGLVPVLWTADPRDWADGSARSIVASTVAQLRPQETNIVLLHDGVPNSANTLLALPRIIRVARTRGYCFAGLDRLGHPAPPVPRATVSDASVEEGPGGSLMTAIVTLDRPTSRQTSVRFRTLASMAASSRDYVGVDRRIRFPAGTTRAMVSVTVRDDPRDESTERLMFGLSAPRGLRIMDGTGIGVIRDDDPPPRLVVRDAAVTEPATGTVAVPITLRLSRASGKRIQVSVSTKAGTADAADFVAKTQVLTLLPGEVKGRFTVTVLADSVVERAETFTVRATEGSNVDLSRATGVVTILPPPPG
jgi:peptidoglycan/xylan/chitin deacetylase (PgdA/CDA1 family)